MYPYRFRKKRPLDFTLSQAKEPQPLQRFRDELIKLIEKSQDAFETQLAFLAGGAIGITITFISDIVPVKESIAKGLLISGWFLLTGTLAINFYSHIIARNNHYKTVQEIDNNTYTQEKAIGRNNRISWWNKLSVACLILGIISILLFIAINMYTMSNTNKQQPNTDLGKKGHQSSPPPPDTTRKTVPLKHGHQSPPPPPSQSPTKKS